MEWKKRPYQRAKLLNWTAELEGQFSQQNAIALSKLLEARAEGYPQRTIDAFEQRADALDRCRELMSQVRTTLYYSK